MDLVAVRARRWVAPGGGHHAVQRSDATPRGLTDGDRLRPAAPGRAARRLSPPVVEPALTGTSAAPQR